MTESPFRNRTREFSDAFNKGVTHATGENVMFLNSGDILLSPDYLKEAEKTLNINPEISFVHSDSLFEDRISGIIYMEPLKSAFYSKAPLGAGNALQSSHHGYPEKCF